MHTNDTNKNGFSLIEVLVSVSIISFILLVLTSFVLEINTFNSKTTGKREVAQNAGKVLDLITYEIKGAKSIYSPTTTQSQLSLETYKYLPAGEEITFTDFFICGTNICQKKESKSPIPLMSNAVKVGSLQFSEVLTGSYRSVKINLTVDYVNPSSNPNNNASISLNSTVSLRSY
ncbi:MAG: type II secretion system protein [Patescibacteria group bacterium]